MPMCHQIDRLGTMLLGMFLIAIQITVYQEVKTTTTASNYGLDPPTNRNIDFQHSNIQGKTM